MTDTSLRIITWNANGLNQRAQELEVFLNINHIDIALISETHFTNKSYIKFNGYKSYWTTHPSERARGGTAVIIKQNITHYEQNDIRENYIQATIITINHNKAELNIAAAYCPPSQRTNKIQYTEIFDRLGSRFIIAGDFNVKHTAWGSRLITPKKGRDLLNAIKSSSCEFHSSKSPTYWPTDCNKVPDLLDFYITKGISSSCIEVQEIADLSSDHTPVLMNISSRVIKKQKKPTLTNKYTDWDSFRNNMDELINLKIKIKTVEELELHAQNLINNIQDAAKRATPPPAEIAEESICYPLEIRELIKERRRRRRVWHRYRHPEDKTIFNRVSNKLNRLIRHYKQSSIEHYLSNLSPEEDKNYSLWKATRRIKRPILHVPPLKNPQGTWTRRDDEKAELFAQHLATIFKPHDIQSDINTTKIFQPNKIIKHVTPLEIAQEIDNNINPKKAPGIDEISPGLLRELPRKGIIMMTYLFNACFRLKHVPICFKIAQIIMLKKPDKTPNELSSYRPISLLPAISKLFEKLLLKRIKPLINIPDFQFGFRNKHSTIDQIHRITSVIEQAFEEKKYCPSVFIDVSQAFDRVWHEGLIYKLSKLLPSNLCQLMESYISERKFRVAYEEARSVLHPIQAGVPQGSVLGPLLYLLYTADIPTSTETIIGTFADDTVIMATSNNEKEATEKLQRALNKITKWTRDWKIKLNELKSVQVTYTLRKKNNQYNTYLNGIQVPKEKSAKYLGLHLDERLNWNHHVKQKALQIRLKLREMYWIVGKHSKLKLTYKRLIYLSTIKPIWAYGIQIWGCTKSANRMIIQRSQNKFLRVITNAYRFVTNEEIHKDLHIKTIDEVISEYARKHHERLRQHDNIEVKQLSNIQNNTRRLKRLKPHNLLA